MTLVSSLKEIEGIRFVKFDTRAKKVEKAVRKGNHVYVLLPNGRVATTNTMLEKYAFMLDDWSWLGDVLDALVELGLVQKHVARAHQILCEHWGLIKDLKMEISLVENREDRFGVLAERTALVAALKEKLTQAETLFGRYRNGLPLDENGRFPAERLMDYVEGPLPEKTTRRERRAHKAGA